jgi:AraC family transcriptional regulator of adaptative response/methylated-DNA-[protein]-cysteine methyltransferase
MKKAHTKPSTTAGKRTAAVVHDQRWQAVLARDENADGKFYYSVKTTGVFCRPSCAARRSKPENVEFHASAADAIRAGFRPCKRCKPDQPPFARRQAQRMGKLCRLIESAERVPNLKQLAIYAGLSSYHLHRVFKAVTGLTPAAYAAAHRGKGIRAALDHGSKVTDAIYAAGYNSSARFYKQSDAVLGMTPTKYRAGGTNTQIRFAIGRCSLGFILVGASERGVCAIFMGDDPDALVRDLRTRFPRAEMSGGDARFRRIVTKVIAAMETPALGIDLPLDVRGTAFQHRVWQAMRKIPAGSTASYTEIAKRIRAPNSVRAVAGACAANVLAVAIPCHRVVRKDGGISGYRWGVERKRALLDREMKPLKSGRT